jgi:hypothetical protein
MVIMPTRPEERSNPGAAGSGFREDWLSDGSADINGRLKTRSEWKSREFTTGPRKYRSRPPPVLTFPLIGGIVPRHLLRRADLWRARDYRELLITLPNPIHSNEFKYFQESNGGKFPTSEEARTSEREEPQA